jgi:hypothetical protein
MPRPRAVVLFLLLPLTVSAVGSIIVTTPRASLDATTLIRDYVFDAGLAIARLDRNASYALADDARFARTSWDCAAWGTQGGVITEKILSLGSSDDLHLVRTGLLNTPLLGDGEVFSTEGQRYHAGRDGKFEANAEYVLSALSWAKHGGLALFDEVSDRIVCAENDRGDRTLVGGGASRVLNDVDCVAAASMLEEKHPTALHATPMNGASVRSTEGNTHVNATGSALFEVVSVTTTFSSLLLPMRPYKAKVGVWSATALLFRADAASGERLGAPLGSQTFNISTTTWVRLASSAHALAPGRYRVELWPANTSAGEKQSMFLSPGWISSTSRIRWISSNNSTNFSSFGGSLTFESTSRVGGAFDPVPPTLAQRVAAAMEWQLRLATLPNGTLDVLTIHEPNWRGVGVDDTGSAGAMWDLIRSGYKDAYINARFIGSLDATMALQAAGVIKYNLTAAVVLAAKAAFVRTFSRNTSYLSWIGCDRTDGTGCSNDTSPSTAGELPVDIGFTPTLALAAALDVRGEGVAAALGRFDSARAAARSVPGHFRTNTIPLESVNVTLWRASSQWKRRGAKGFAVRANNTGGDWHIFDPAEGPADGYGQFGNTEENGGIILSTTALVFAAGVYPKLWSDFREMARAVTTGALQLSEGANGTSTPLMASFREYLRLPIARGGIVEHLCAARRGEKAHEYDRWGEQWCNYYKSVSWNLPGGGSFAYAFARGLLRLDVAINAGTLTVYGAPIPLDPQQAATAVPLPAWAQARWPTELRDVGTTIKVTGVNVLGTPCHLTCTVSGTITALALTCTAGRATDTRVT